MSLSSWAEGSWETDSLGGEVELVALTLWESRAAIEAFAGKDIGRAHVEPQARAVLASFDDVAEHYEVAYAD